MKFHVIHSRTAHNSRFSQLRILLKPVVDFPLENLILAESTQFRTSQLTRSGGTLTASCTERIFKGNLSEN
jgi:hypothetical protein